MGSVRVHDLHLQEKKKEREEMPSTLFLQALVALPRFFGVDE